MMRGRGRPSGRGPAGRALARLFGAACIVAAAVGCGTAAAPGLRSVGTMVPSTVTQADLPAGRPATFGSILVCADASGPVTLTDLTLPSATGGLAVAAFAVRPDPGPSARIGIADEGLSSPLVGASATGPGPVAACEAGGSEVLVEVDRAGGGDGCAPAGLDLHYRSAEAGTGVLHVPLALAVGAGDAPCA
jgi:hypothetical protein